MSLTQRFTELDRFLTTHQQLWCPRPFYFLELAWEQDYPELSQWLRSRTLEEAEHSHNTPWALTAPEPYASLAAQSHRLCTLNQAALPINTPEPSGVPGRKWQQIQAFANALSFCAAPTHILDWCAGKGHLGRYLAQAGTALTLLEYDPYLVAEGERLSEQQKIPAKHLCQDVLDDSVRALITEQMTPVALHACGDLHTKLVKIAAEQTTQLAIAPCCYNRISTPSYQPLSALGKASSLSLSLEDLALPLSETVTAGQRVRRQRDQSMAWRLGFDLIQRTIRQTDQYLPTPSLSSQWLNGSFQAFAEHLAERKKLHLVDIDWAYYEQQGYARLGTVRNLELVRALFRRPMELWLLLDKALYLEENGFSCQITEFCPSSLSPRNLLLQAHKSAKAPFVRTF